jgi:hypothetical protein
MESSKYERWSSTTQCDGFCVGTNQGHLNEPTKDFGFAPYLMFIIKDVIRRSFPKEGKRMPFRPNPTKKPLIPPAHASSLL